MAVSGVDEIFGVPSAWGLGYAIGYLGSDEKDSPTVFGMGGAGGSWAGADTASGLALAVTKNRLTMDFEAATQSPRPSATSWSARDSRTGAAGGVVRVSSRPGKEYVQLRSNVTSAPGGVLRADVLNRSRGRGLT